jgi:uncharacterized protein (DUF488 family)
MTKPTRLFTIGFTHSSAEHFFTRLSQAGVKRVVDVRLNNVSQLAGFSKKDDLSYFLKGLCGIDYVHDVRLAPTQEIFEAFKKRKGDWQTFQTDFLALLRARKIEEALTRDQVHEACLLCSEDRPHHCHRRLVAEYLKDKWGGLEILHL